MNPEKYSSLLDHYRPYLEAFARRYVRDAMVAEDMVSDSFVAFWERAGQLGADLNLQAYLFKTVRNRCYNWLCERALHARIEQDIHSHNRRMVEANILSLKSCDPDRLFVSEVASIVEQTLLQYPQLTRDIFNYSRRLNKSYKEIAEELGITTRRVDYELQRVTKALREALADYLPILIACGYIAGS